MQDAHVCIELPNSDLIKIPWCKGTEGLATLTENKLWTHLGLDKKQLPFFNRFTDPDAIIEPWTEDGEKWLTSKSSNRKPLQPCWHQLVRIYCMLQHTFEAKLVLLMDGVRIGKTFQVIGFIMCLSHFHWHYNAHKKFPGAFSEWFYTQSFIHIHHPLTHSFPANKRWHDKEGNIPSAPFIIVCPVNLHNQWTCEIEQFLKCNTFDIFPYVRKHITHCQWWENIYTKGFHELHHQIVLAMDSVSTCYLSAIVALTL